MSTALYTAATATQDVPRQSRPQLLLHAVVLVLVLLAMHPDLGVRSSDRVGEYCDTEVFHAECPSREVILMKTARYGRMRVGRCVEYDLGYINCYTDVLLRVDRRCSGRRTCEIRIPDAEFESTGPCLKELKTYMEVSYACVPIETASAEYCSTHTYLNLTSSTGYFGNVLTTPTLSTNSDVSSSGAISSTATCDHTIYPWVIVARTGQRINLTLYDFALDNAHGTNIQRLSPQQESGRICRQYGWMEDSAYDRPTPICGGSDRRTSDAYVSRGSVLKVWSIPADNPADVKRFVIKYTITGCPDLDVLPDQMWFERTPDGYANIGCQNADVKWTVQCVENIWVGHRGNCSAKKSEQREYGGAEITDDEISIPYGLAIGVGAAIGIMLALIIVLVVGCNRKPSEEERQLERNKRVSLQLRQLESTYIKHPCACTLQQMRSPHPDNTKQLPAHQQQLLHQQQQQLHNQQLYACPQQPQLYYSTEIIKPCPCGAAEQQLQRGLWDSSLLVRPTTAASPLSTTSQSKSESISDLRDVTADETGDDIPVAQLPFSHVLRSSFPTVIDDNAFGDDDNTCEPMYSRDTWTSPTAAGLARGGGGRSGHEPVYSSYIEKQSNIVVEP